MTELQTSQQICDETAELVERLQWVEGVSLELGDALARHQTLTFQDMRELQSGLDELAAWIRRRPLRALEHQLERSELRALEHQLDLIKHELDG